MAHGPWACKGPGAARDRRARRVIPICERPSRATAPQAWTRGAVPVSWPCRCVCHGRRRRLPACRGRSRSCPHRSLPSIPTIVIEAQARMRRPGLTFGLAVAPRTRARCAGAARRAADPDPVAPDRTRHAGRPPGSGRTRSAGRLQQRCGSHGVAERVSAQSRPTPRSAVRLRSSRRAPWSYPQRSKVAKTGAWSEGFSQPRAARSTREECAAAAMSALAQTWSRRRPLSAASQSGAR